jgi:hypothetical protein
MPFWSILYAIAAAQAVLLALALWRRPVNIAGRKYVRKHHGLSPRSARTHPHAPVPLKNC